MKESSFGNKINRAIGIATIGALSLSPLESATEEQKIIDIPQNKIEWSPEEIETKEVTTAIAEHLTREADVKDYKEVHEMISKSLERYSIELIKREMFMPGSEDFSGQSTKFIKEEIENYKRLQDTYRIKYENALNPTSNKQSASFKEMAEYRASQIKETLSAYDEGRQWVLDNLNSPEYAKRFSSGMDSVDIMTAEIDIQDRINRASERNFIVTTDMIKSHGQNENSKNVGAFYRKDEDRAYFKLIKEPSLAVDDAIHEYAHKITMGNSLLTKKEIQIFSEAFDSLSVVVNLSDCSQKDVKKQIVYYSTPTEMYARKKEFDHQLKELGVKEYEEEFTVEHYIKSIQLRDSGKLRPGSVEFMYSVKPKLMRKVMNEIAEVETPKDPANEQNLG